MKKIFTLLTLLCLAVAANAQTSYELSPTTFKSSDSLVTEEPKDTFVVWSFTSKSKNFAIKCKKEWATGSGTTKGTMKLSRNHDFTVELPEGLSVNAIRVTGWTNKDEAANVTKATVKINGEDDTNELPFRTTTEGADFTIDLASPITGSFIFRINNEQACVKLYLITDEEGGQAEVTYNATATYALAEGDTFTSGQEVDVNDANGQKIATVVYGETGGADFNAATANAAVSGFAAFTGGNGVNGDKEGGTSYTIKPVYDGAIDVAVVLNADKSFYILEDGAPMEEYNGIRVASKYQGTYKFTVKAGSAYKIYCAGSKLGFYGFNYSYNADGGDTPTPSGYDLNGDGSVNVVDVMELIQYVLDHMGN